MPWRAEGLGQQPHLGLGQPRQRGQVAGAVAVLGEETHQGLGAVVGAHHQAVAEVGHRVLGQHPRPGLDVALDEVREGRRRLQAVDPHLVHQALDAVGNVASAHRVGAYEVEASLGITFIRLLPIRQAHGDETGLLPRGAHLLHRQLAQAAGGQGIHPTTDAQYQGAAAGLAQYLLDKGHTPGDLGGLATANQLPIDAQFPGDACLG